MIHILSGTQLEISREKTSFNTVNELIDLNHLVTDSALRVYVRQMTQNKEMVQVQTTWSPKTKVYGPENI